MIEVRKIGSDKVFTFSSMEDAKDFCNSFIALENARGAEFPELKIIEK